MFVAWIYVFRGVARCLSSSKGCILEIMQYLTIIHVIARWSQISLWKEQKKKYIEGKIFSSRYVTTLLTGWSWYSMDNCTTSDITVRVTLAGIVFAICIFFLFLLKFKYIYRLEFVVSSWYWIYSWRWISLLLY